MTESSPDLNESQHIDISNLTDPENIKIDNRTWTEKLRHKLSEENFSEEEIDKNIPKDKNPAFAHAFQIVAMQHVSGIHEKFNPGHIEGLFQDDIKQPSYYYHEIMACLKKYENDATNPDSLIAQYIKRTIEKKEVA